MENKDSQAVYDHLLSNMKKTPQKSPFLGRGALIGLKTYTLATTIVFTVTHHWFLLAFYLIPCLLIIFLSEWKWKG